MPIRGAAEEVGGRQDLGGGPGVRPKAYEPCP